MKKSSVMLFVSALALSGCATVFQGTKEKVSFESSPSGARLAALFTLTPSSHTGRAQRCRLRLVAAVDPRHVPLDAARRRLPRRRPRRRRRARSAEARLGLLQRVAGRLGVQLLAAHGRRCPRDRAQRALGGGAGPAAAARDATRRALFCPIARAFRAPLFSRTM